MAVKQGYPQAKWQLSSHPRWSRSQRSRRQPSLDPQTKRATATRLASWWHLKVVFTPT